MIPFKLPQERDTILKYAKLLNDAKTESIIARDELRNKEEATHLAEFYWKMVEASNSEEHGPGNDSEYILEKIIITLMAYFRATGYEKEWDEISDKY